MSGGRPKPNSSDSGERLLYWAMLASLVFHLGVFGGYEAGRRYGWWQKSFLPKWLQPTAQILAEIKKNQPLKPPQPQQEEIPLVFVEVDPAAAIKEPPKNSRYYSSKNSEAANTEANQDTQTPKISGSQTHVAKTETVPRAVPVPLQPSLAKPEPDTQTAKPSEPKPKGGQPIGDLALAKPADKPGETQEDEVPKPTHHRPNTLVEAKMRQAITGEKMKQDGGVRRLKLDSLDARATPFGEYDRELIEAIQNRWYDLLDRKDFSRDRVGKVVLDFNLGADGRVTDMRVVENGVDDLLCYVCQRAILDPAPFAPWPPDMRRLINGDQREVRFTFFYE